MSQVKKTHCRFTAVAWIVMWSAFFSTAMALAKLLDPGVNPVTLIFFRSFFGAIVAMPLFMRIGFMTHFKTTKLRLHLIRIVIVTCGMGATYYAYRNLPISYAAAIGQTGPLFTTFVAIIFLRERAQWFKWVALIVGYSGVLLMVRPSEGGIDSSTLIALTANLLAAFGVALSKKLTETDASETILFYATFGVLFVSSILLLGYGQMPTKIDLVKLLGMGLAGVMSQYCYINALKYAPASFVTPFEYTRLCVSIPIGYFLFDEAPDKYLMLGSLIIVGAIIFLVYADQERNNAKEKAKGNG